MKVTAVSAWFPTKEAPSRGSFVVRDVHAISAHHDVRLIHLVPPQDDDGTRRVTVEGIDTLRIPFSPSSPHTLLPAARALRAALKGADLVHTMAFPSLLPLLPRRPEQPWVHTEHWSALTTPETLPASHQLALRGIKQALRRPDLTTAVCEFLAQPIREVRRGKPTTIVPCIVDPVSPVPRRDRSDGALRMVSTGGLIERKDPLVAVRTVAELVARGADPHLRWVGAGPLAEETERLASELGVADRVVLVGTLDTEGVRRELGAADLFFGPTRADNFFVSAAEAIVSGRPVVLGATGGQGEYTLPAVGSLVKTQDPAAYADAILDVDARTRGLTSEDIAATIGDAFSTATVGDGYAVAYDQALHLRKR